MKVANKIIDFTNHTLSLNLHPLGFVPTMGALHEGHLSLVKSAVSGCPLVAVSIFVNPTQFNDKEDLRNYPRTLDKDLKMLESVMRSDDVVLAPDASEIYPEPDTRVFSFGNLDKVMEAVQRPGHFNGVAQVVSRLFDIVKPDVAYFGQKDFQQLAVIKELVRLTGNNVKIIGNPIIRESDGLAMSSRNTLLEPNIRKNAPIIYNTIAKASSMVKENDIAEIKDFVEKTINNEVGFKVEYFEIVDDTELIPVNGREEMRHDKKYFGCIAVRAGRIRLIDNIEIGLF
jgi:pantoate--beta-alanine ligase